MRWLRERAMFALFRITSGFGAVMLRLVWCISIFELLEMRKNKGGGRADKAEFKRLGKSPVGYQSGLAAWRPRVAFSGPQISRPQVRFNGVLRSKGRVWLGSSTTMAYSTRENKKSWSSLRRGMSPF